MINGFLKSRVPLLHNALDFDDLLLKTVELFEKSERVRTKYAEQFRFVMVDEYQDTNRPQYLLISRLAGYYCLENAAALKAEAEV